MKTTYNIKETFAWIVFFLAAFLFTATISLAQDKDSGKKDKTTIRIIEKKNGKTTKLDTTVYSMDEKTIDEILDAAGFKHRKDFSLGFNESFTDEDSGDHRGMTKEEQAEFKKAMKHLKKEMKAVHDKLKNIRIEISSDRNGSENEEGFNGTPPPAPIAPAPPIPPMPGSKFDFHFFGDHDFESSDDDSPGEEDLQQDDEHVIIRGSEDEKPPVLEKEVVGKHGEKIFIFKRQQPDAEKPNDGSFPGNDGLKLYPNPNEGRFTLKFMVPSKTDLSVNVFDDQGREVYSETIKEFSGNYHNRLDLSGKGKGNYILKVTMGDKVLTQKFIIE